MKKFLGIAFFVVSSFAGGAAQAEVLNVPYFVGRLTGGCTEMFPEDAVTSEPPQLGCGVRIPIPLLLKQVRILSSSTQASGDFLVQGMILTRAYKTMPDAGEVAIAAFSDSTMNPGVGMVAKAMMVQSGIPPHISYTDAFVLQPDTAYSVNAIVTGDAMFHGIQLVYE